MSDAAARVVQPSLGAAAAATRCVSAGPRTHLRRSVRGRAGRSVEGDIERARIGVERSAAEQAGDRGASPLHLLVCRRWGGGGGGQPSGGLVILSTRTGIVWTHGRMQLHGQAQCQSVRGAHGLRLHGESRSWLQVCDGMCQCCLKCVCHLTVPSAAAVARAIRMGPRSARFEPTRFGVAEPQPLFTADHSDCVHVATLKSNRKEREDTDRTIS